jgi:lysine decarboxylase
MCVEKALKKYSASNPARFHMPGHKGKSIDTEEDSFLDYAHDVTEIEGLDLLHNPKGVIKEMLDRIASTYDVYKSYLSTNGSTTALQAAILSATRPHDQIIMSRDCHKSIYNAVILGALTPVYLPIEYDENIKLSCIRDFEAFERVIQENNEAKLVVITYPTYFGLCTDIAKMADIVHRHNKLLLVDEAHGAHLKFSPHLPLSAEEAGADIVVQSVHKTLPALTQASLLHIGKGVDEERVESMLSLLLTTSPSYLIMGSIEKAVTYMQREGELKLSENLDIIKERIDQLPYAQKAFKSSEYFKENGVFDFDRTKLLFRTDEFGINGQEVKHLLRKDYGIEMEMATPEYVNGFMTVGDNRQDLERLFDAMDDLLRKHMTRQDEYATPSETDNPSIPEQAMSIRDAFYAPKEWIEISEASNHIAGEHIIPYPPGIPLVCMGERITPQIKRMITRYLDSGIEVIGIKNNRVRIVK